MSNETQCHGPKKPIRYLGTPCARVGCEHPWNFHAPGGRCLKEGCSCVAFIDAGSVEPVTKEHRIAAARTADVAVMRAANPPMFAPSLADLSRLMEAFGAITYREFCAVLAETNHAADDYCRGVWGPFRAAPLGYCASRSGTQGQALLALAVEKIRMAEISGRAIGCPGDGRCHDEVHHCASCGDVAMVCERVDICQVHRAATDAEVGAAVLDEFIPHVARDRKRHRREHLVSSMLLRFAYRAGFDVARAERAVDSLLADGAVRLATLAHWEGWLEAPLAVFKPGDHSNQCPVTVEHWNERARHEPDVCAWIPPEDFSRRVLDVLRDRGDLLLADGVSIDEIAEALRCPPADVEKACVDMGARNEHGAWFPPRDGAAPTPTSAARPHNYPGVASATQGNGFFTSDCAHGCGAWMGDSRSGAPDGIDPVGTCPKNTCADEDEP